MPKKIDLNDVPKHVGTTYPTAFAAACAHRVRQRLGDAVGLTDFGVNLMQCCAPATAPASRRASKTAIIFKIARIAMR